MFSGKLTASTACSNSDFTALAIEYALRRRCCARHTETARAKKHSLCEHLLSGKLTASTVCSNSDFAALAIGYALRRSFSFACSADRFYSSVIRVFRV